MSASIISICNRAILAIGGRAQISSLNEGSTEANACATLFIPTFEALGRSAYWNCLRKQAALSLLAAAQGTPENPDGTTLPLPPVPWLYQYALPSDCLDVRFLVPSLPNSTASGSVPFTTVNNQGYTILPSGEEIVFAVAYATDATNNPINVILTNQTQAQCVYTVNQPNPIIWDSLFQQAMVGSLAAYLVPALTLDMELMQIQIKVAEQAIEMARVRDGDESVMVMDHLPDFIRARSSGGYIGYGCYSGNYNTFCPMVWPGGY